MTDIEDYRNQVFNEDIRDVLKRLPSKSIDCAFADPDYNVGVSYNDVTYRRKFDEYISWCIGWASETLRVLKDDGNFFIVNYPKNNAYLRTRFLDGASHDVHEYVWVYNTNVGHAKNRFTTAHRTILHATKSKHNRFFKDQVAEPYKNPTDHRIRENLRHGSKGRMPYSWIYSDLVKNVSREKTFHSCQIPQSLSDLLVRASTQPGDLVLVHFGGSGAELEVCKRLRRDFVSAEIDEKYHQMIVDRLARGKIMNQWKLPVQLKHLPPEQRQLSLLGENRSFSR